MIFSAKKWNNGKELKAVMKVNTAISFDMMEAPLRNAFRQYLVPLLGDAMVGEVVEIYEFGPNPDVLEQNTEGATERAMRHRYRLDRQPAHFRRHCSMEKCSRPD